jgi:hypothetical protein
LASTIYYTGIDPYTKKKVFVVKTQEQKLKQRSYFFWYQNHGQKAKDLPNGRQAKDQISNIKKKK